MLNVLVVSSIVKLLLVRAYRSTDFEVHRNWLAITYSLPISEWYYEKTSEWTLDYPPFFAWFERCLATFAPLADEKMLQVDNLNYASENTVLFQRLTVIVSELVLYWAILRYRRSFGSKYVHWVIAGSIFLHPGFLIVDHLHFQYNGFLYGILLHSIVEMKKRRYLLSGFLFAALLNFKHIYLYMAPAYFVYLLKAYCFQPIPTPTENGHADRQAYANVSRFSLANFVKLGATVAAVFAISLGPFVYMGQIPQLLSRLFPFTRGLCHAYWAPNFWALYAGADRVLIIIGKRLGWSLNQDALGSMTRGFVGDTKFAVLPQVDAIHTLIITVIAQLIPLQLLWRKPTFNNFLTSLVLCGFASFLFGWHVHEKAILLILIPYSLMAANTKAHLRIFIILSASGIYSLFPLLFHSAETPIKTIFTLTWFLIVLPSLARTLHTPLRAVLHPLECLYLVGLVMLQLYTDVLHTVIFGTGKLEFLPLMMISIYTALGVCYGWVRLMVGYLNGTI
ncbi:glycosyltransferase family 57 protein [Umbelopsis sp. AD052]|nr:glycosyltransferase family 57 protein [Umbelopsis sp. AD052]